MPCEFNASIVRPYTRAETEKIASEIQENIKSRKDSNKHEITKIDKMNNENYIEHKNVSCVVCYQDIIKHEPIVSLECRHIFHLQCIAAYANTIKLSKKELCPMKCHNTNKTIIGSKFNSLEDYLLLSYECEDKACTKKRHKQAGKIDMTFKKLQISDKNITILNTILKCIKNTLAEILSCYFKAIVLVIVAIATVCLSMVILFFIIVLYVLQAIFEIYKQFADAIQTIMLKILISTGCHN